MILPRRGWEVFLSLVPERRLPLVSAGQVSLF
jgi:hypothetical protein